MFLPALPQNRVRDLLCLMFHCLLGLAGNQENMQRTPLVKNSDLGNHFRASAERDIFKERILFVWFWTLIPLWEGAKHVFLRDLIRKQKTESENWFFISSTSSHPGPEVPTTGPQENPKKSWFYLLMQSDKRWIISHIVPGFNNFYSNCNYSQNVKFNGNQFAASDLLNSC